MMGNLFGKPKKTESYYCAHLEYQWYGSLGQDYGKQPTVWFCGHTTEASGGLCKYHQTDRCKQKRMQLYEEFKQNPSTDNETGQVYIREPCTCFINK